MADDELSRRAGAASFRLATSCRSYVAHCRSTVPASMSPDCRTASETPQARQAPMAQRAIPDVDRGTRGAGIEPCHACHAAKAAAFAVPSPSTPLRQPMRRGSCAGCSMRTSPGFPTPPPPTGPGRPEIFDFRASRTAAASRKAASWSRRLPLPGRSAAASHVCRRCQGKHLSWQRSSVDHLAPRCRARGTPFAVGEPLVTLYVQAFRQRGWHGDNGPCPTSNDATRSTTPRETRGAYIRWSSSFAPISGSTLG